MSDAQVPGYEQQPGRVDAYRVLEALGHIGYTPVSAIFDIVDNAVTATASQIDIAFELEPGLAETRRNNVQRYLIADNGVGMDRAGLENALQLGSQISPQPHSLSKFGMGLKSAALSQGNRLTLLSRTADSDLDKAVLDVDVVRESGEYMLMFGGVTDDDGALWERCLQGAPSGTVVVIDKIHKVNHPSARTTRDELRRQIGVYYYYFIAEDGLQVRLDGEVATGFDPLFAEEANQHEQLDASSWDGATVRWSLKPTEVTLDSERNVKATVSATQLPHPFTFGDERAAIRRRYMIGPGNYGFYVYRNKRLISWADRFEQVIPYEQEYWSFRGRILIDDEADEVLNVDVKKSRVLLSEEALQALGDLSYELRLKAKNGWQNAFRLYKEHLGASASQVADEILDEVHFPDVLPTDPDDSKTEEERERRSARQAERKPMNPEEQEDVRQRGQRVQLVPFLDDNVLWERAHDAELGIVVRLNRSHRFIRLVFEHFQDDALVMTILKGTFFGLAQSESHAVRAIQEVPDVDLERIFLRFREIASQLFGAIARDGIERALERTPE